MPLCKHDENSMKEFFRQVHLDPVRPPTKPAPSRSKTVTVKPKGMQLHAVPTKTTPDWIAVRDHIKAHGCMRLEKEGVTSYNAAHAALHRHGIGLYMLTDDMGVHVGWIARPLKGEKA